MFAQYGTQHRWTTQFNNTGPHIQLEEQFLPPEHTQAHLSLTHDATLVGSYHAAPTNMSQRPAAARRSVRPQAIAINTNAFDHNSQGAYMGGTSSSEIPGGQPPNIANIFHPHAPQQHVYHQQSYSAEAQAQIPVQSTNASDPLTSNMQWQTGPSPQFTSSPVSINPPPAQGANSAYYCIDAQQQQQQTFEFGMMRSTSGSQSNLGETMAGQDYLHQTKRVRPNDEDDKPNPFCVDVGMDHEAQGSQDSKGPNKTKLGACARCKSLKVR